MIVIADVIDKQSFQIQGVYRFHFESRVRGTIVEGICAHGESSQRVYDPWDAIFRLVPREGEDDDSFSTGAVSVPVSSTCVCDFF